MTTSEAISRAHDSHCNLEGTGGRSATCTCFPSTWAAQSPLTICSRCAAASRTSSASISLAGDRASATTVPPSRRIIDTSSVPAITMHPEHSAECTLQQAVEDSCKCKVQDSHTPVTPVAPRMPYTGCPEPSSPGMPFRFCSTSDVELRSFLSVREWICKDITNAARCVRGVKASTGKQAPDYVKVQSRDREKERHRARPCPRPAMTAYQSLPPHLPALHT